MRKTTFGDCFTEKITMTSTTSIKNIPTSPQTPTDETINIPDYNTKLMNIQIEALIAMCLLDTYSTDETVFTHVDTTRKNEHFPNSRRNKDERLKIELSIVDYTRILCKDGSISPNTQIFNIHEINNYLKQFGIDDESIVNYDGSFKPNAIYTIPSEKFTRNLIDYVELKKPEHVDKLLDFLTKPLVEKMSLANEESTMKQYVPTFPYHYIEPSILGQQASFTDSKQSVVVLGQGSDSAKTMNRGLHKKSRVYGDYNVKPVKMSYLIGTNTEASEFGED
jgi:hypothetical protein